MRGLTAEELTTLEVVCSQSGYECNGACGSFEWFPDHVEEALIARGLVTVSRGLMCGVDHADITPLGRLALRLPVSAR